MKRLVFCADGTWKKEGAGISTNVVRIKDLIAPYDNAVLQIVKYDPGVGTSLFDRIRGGVFGRGLRDNVKDGYRFLAQHHEDGDEIYLFGFSRGAYTARRIAGMIAKVGLLPATHVDAEIGRAWAIYRDQRLAGDTPAITQWRAAYKVKRPRIRCVGVWDTVGSYGIPLRGLRDVVRLLPVIGSRYRKRFEFKDTDLSPTVDFGFHAIAIDEQRTGFDATPWNPAKGDTPQIEQVWFTGVHSDVGGGLADRGLSDITLAWMIERVADRCGLRFDTDRARLHLDPSFAAPSHESRTGIYRLLPSNPRAIPHDATVAQSAVARARLPALHGDTPPLKKFLKNRNGDPPTVVPVPGLPPPASG